MEIDTLYQKKILDVFKDLSIKPDPEFNRNFCQQSLRRMRMRTYQRFAVEYFRRFVRRGLLLVHGLGSGKTFTAVNVANAEKSRDIVILLPASLRANFEKNIARHYKAGKNVSYLSYNAPNIMTQYRRLAPASLREKEGNYFDGKLIIIEECHIFFQNVISGKAKQAIELYNLLDAARRAKFLLLTGTPISGDPFELVPLFNLIRPIKSPLFPDDYGTFRRHFVSEEFNSIMNKEVFQDRITGLVSYYRGMRDDERYVIPELLKTDFIKCRMGPAQWAAYLAARAEEWDFERKSKYSREAFRQSRYKKASRASVGTYKTSSAQACNFTFPQLIEQQYRAAVAAKGKATLGEIAAYKWKLMEAKGAAYMRKIFGDIAAFSGKLAVLERLVRERAPFGKIFIFTRYKITGSLAISRFLQLRLGYSAIKERDINDPHRDPLEARKAFVVVNGDTKDKDKMIQVYNRRDNTRGEKCGIIIGTTVMAAGVNLRETRTIIVFDAQFRDVMVRQTFGRGVRTCSHAALPLADRDVKPYFLLATAPGERQKLKIEIDRGMTTDEILHELSVRRETMNGTFEHSLKEAAVDCELNLYDNNTAERPIECRVCINDPPRLLIPASWKQHLIDGPRCLKAETREKLVEYSHDGRKLMKDGTGALYEWNSKEKAYEEVGYLKDGFPIFD